MGIDLHLLPFEYEDEEESFSYTTLVLECRSNLWTEIKKFESFSVPEEFETPWSGGPDEDWHVGNTQIDIYGQPLRWVWAKDLKSLANHTAVQDNHVNRAAWAYLNELPDETKVALYWC